MHGPDTERRLAEIIDTFPRVSLARTPTPLDRLANLGTRLGTQVYLKRDDLTGLALGGDKPRKLEYELGRAREEGADVLVTCGSMQSNHARLTTAAARSSGLDCTLVLSRDAYAELQGNLLTVYLMGASVRIVDVDDHWGLEPAMWAVCAELRAQGRRPHQIPVSGTTALSCLGYVRAGLELAEQLRSSGIRPDVVYTPFGTGGIYTGLLLALRNAGFDCQLVGISVNRDRDTCRQSLDHWWNAICELTGTDADMPKGPTEIHDEFVGVGYGDPTPACLDAILTMAHDEGILLDPVYSGKMLAGFLSHHQQGQWHGRTAVLLHSGGVPALFAYHDAIRAHLAARGVPVDGLR